MRIFRVLRHRNLSGQPGQEPRWQRAAHVIDGSIGEALGQLYVEKYFPPAARARMNDLVENIKAVFRDRLPNVEWMTAATRAKALAKFDRVHPKNRPSRQISRLFLRRTSAPMITSATSAAPRSSSHSRELARVGKPVDKHRVAHDSAHRQRLFQPLAKRNRLPRRHPPTTVL